MPRHATPGNAGFSLLYVIAVIAALSTLAASIASLTGTGFIAELNESFATRARYIALAGFNYARQFREDYSELEDKTFTLGMDKFAFSNYRQFQDSTGIMRIEFKVVGTAAAGTAQEANYVIYDNFESQDQGAITFAQNFDDFVPNVSDPSKTPITKNSDKTFTIGNNQYNAFGSFYYTGTKMLNWGHNNCTNGICDFQEGVRVFFVSRYDSNAADGIVMTIFNSNNNTIASIGGDSQHGEMIGYAADSRVYNSGNGSIYKFVEPNQWGIRPPKIGIEFDNYTNNGTGTICASTGPASNPVTGQRSDIDSDHIAYVFWGGDNDAGVRFASGFECAYCGANTLAATDMSNTGNMFNYLWPTLNTLAYGSCANKSGTSAYAGKYFPAGKIITGFRVYASNNRGFSGTGSGINSGSVTIKLYGGNSSTFSTGTATQLASVTVTNANNAVATAGDISAGQTALSNSTSYTYYWVYITGTSTLYIAHVQFLETINNIYANTTDYPNNTTQVPAYIPYTASSNSSQKTNWQGALAYDDNRHGSGQNAVKNTSTSTPQRGFWKAVGWTTGEAFAYRGEIERGLSPVSSGINAGKYAYRLISWFRRCGNTNCLQYINATGTSTAETNRAYFSDTSRFLCAYNGSYTGEDGSTMTDYSRCTVANTPVLDQTIYLTATEHAKFDDMIFGFTEATGGSTQSATYSYFTLQFLKPNDYVTGTSTRRRIINREIKCTNSSNVMVDCP